MRFTPASPDHCPFTKSGRQHIVRISKLSRRNPTTGKKYMHKLVQNDRRSPLEFFRHPTNVHCIGSSLDISGNRTRSLLFGFFGRQSRASRFALASCVGVKCDEIRAYPDRALWRCIPRKLVVARRNQAQAQIKSTGVASLLVYISASLL